MPGGRSWSKRGHLQRLRASGHFAYAREIVLDQQEGGGAERFVDLLRSQGSYQTLRKAGLTDDEIGLPAFEAAAREAFSAAGEPPAMSFCYRVRFAVTAR
jgi:hypothetical protein